MSPGYGYFVTKVKRRDQLQIVSSILYSAIECVMKKELRSSVGIDTPRLDRYIEALIGRGFLERNGEKYCTSDKGLKLLRLLLDLSRTYRGLSPHARYSTENIRVYDPEKYIAAYIGKARSNYDRVYCLLSQLYIGITSKAKVQGYCSFNSDQYFKYMNLLVENGLIAVEGNEIRITEKGLMYLRIYEEIIRLFEEE